MDHPGEFGLGDDRHRDQPVLPIHPEIPDSHGGEPTGQLLQVLRPGGADAQDLPAHPGAQFGARAGGDHPPLVHHDDRIRQRFGLLHVLRGEQHRGPVRHQLAHGIPQVVPAARIQSGGRFVQVQQRRVADHARGQVQPPPHSAGVLARRPGRRVDQVELLQQLVDAFPGTAARQIQQPGDHVQVLPARDALVHRGVLAGQADQPAHLVGLLDQVVTADAGLAAVRPDQRGQHPDGGGLARAVGP